jgi:hypothetical protein
MHNSLLAIDVPVQAKQRRIIDAYHNEKLAAGATCRLYITDPVTVGKR